MTDVAINAYIGLLLYSKHFQNMPQDDTLKLFWVICTKLFGDNWRKYHLRLDSRPREKNLMIIHRTLDGLS